MLGRVRWVPCPPLFPPQGEYELNMESNVKTQICEVDSEGVGYFDDMEMKAYMAPISSPSECLGGPRWT